MINLDLDTLCRIDYSAKFKKQLKKILKQNKNEKLLLEIVTKLANKEKLEPKYRDHSLNDNKHYENCRECHLTPDWLLIYKYTNNELVLLLTATGSHADLFKM